MKFTLTKEQIDIQNMVREFACEKVGPIAAQIDKEHRFPLETVKEMAKLGLLGMAYPEELNGKGTDYVSYALSIIELAKKCASTATIMSGTNSLCSGPIYSWGTDEQKRKYLPQLLSGEKLGAFALTEPGAGSDAAGQQTKAELIDDHWVLNGT